MRDVLGNSYMQGVTVRYSPSGVLLWEAFWTPGTVWASALPSGDVCATGGYDALSTAGASRAPCAPGRAFRT